MNKNSDYKVSREYVLEPIILREWGDKSPTQVYSPGLDPQTSK